jgi:uncharacterized membrane protein YqjE
MRNALLNYLLMAMLAVCLVGLLAMALAPAANAFAHAGKAISAALAGGK